MEPAPSENKKTNGITIEEKKKKIIQTINEIIKEKKEGSESFSEEKSVKIFTPKDLYDKIQSQFFRDVVVVRGYVVKYGEYFKLSYDDYELDLVNVPEDVNVSYDQSLLVDVKGYLTYTVYNKGGIYLKLNVLQIQPVKTEMGYTYVSLSPQVKKELEEKILKRTDYSFYSYVTRIFKEKRKLKVLIIHGKDAQTHLDFLNAFSSTVKNQEVKKRIEFAEAEVVLSSDRQLAEIFEKCNSQFDVIFVVRGGGSKEELAKIGGIESLKRMVELPCGVYVAFGHFLDRGFSLIEKYADGSFITPTKAGVEFASLLDNLYENLNKEERISDLEEKLVEVRKVEEEKMKKFEEERKELVTIVQKLTEENKKLLMQQKDLEDVLQKFKTKLESKEIKDKERKEETVEKREKDLWTYAFYVGMSLVILILLVLLLKRLF